MLNDEERILVCNAIYNELLILEKIRSNSKCVKVFDEIYKEHMDAMKNIKQKLE